MDPKEYKIYQTYMEKCDELNREYNIIQIDDDYIYKDGVDMGEEFDMQFKKIHDDFIESIKNFHNQNILYNTIKNHI